MFLCLQLFDQDSWTYSYLLADINAKEAIIIDPVLEQAKRDAELIKELGFTLKYAGKLFSNNRNYKSWTHALFFFWNGIMLIWMEVFFFLLNLID